jgi:hypothetical protein
MRPSTRLTLGCAAVLVVSSIAGCKKDSTSPGSSAYAGTYAGPIAGAVTSGVLTLTVHSASASAPVASSPAQFSLEGTEAVVTLSGTLTIAGDSSYTVSGSFNNSTGQIVTPPGVTAGPYTIVGGFVAGAFVGTWKSATDSGSWTLPAVPAGGAKVLCGVFTGSSNGVWNLAVTGGTLHGVAGSANGTLPLGGTIATTSPFTMLINSPVDPNIVASGTLFSPPDSAHGIWADTSTGDAGTWNGSVAACN